MVQEYNCICQVCLLLDKKVHKIESAGLFQFYRELSNCSSGSSAFSDPDVQCCTQCEYLLIKMYNFKQKCILAYKILESWRTSKIQESLATLHQKLPPTALGPWIPDDCTIFCYQEEEFDTTTMKLEDDIDIYEDPLYDELPDVKDDILNDEVPPSNEEPEPNDNAPSIIQVLGSKNILTIKPLSNPPPVLRLSRNETLQVTECNNMPRTEVLPNTDMTKSESTLIVPEEVDQKSAFDLIVTETKPANNNKSSTNGPVLCLQDIFASLTAAIKQTGNELNDIDNDETHTYIDHDYCEPEQPRKRITKEPKIRRTYKGKRREMRYSKKNLKALLTELFSSCGELISCNAHAHESTTIDKDFILSLVDHKMSERRMKVLWDLLYGKRKIVRDGLYNLAMLQNIYSNDEYESVFDIVYLITENEVRREFQNRKTYKSYIDAKFKCEICYEGFTHEKRLIYHQRYHDESVGGYECEICNRRYPLKRQFRKHQPLHEIVYKCKLCPLVTTYRDAMINHFNQHNGVEYKCPGCDATFKSRSASLNHLTKHCSAASIFCTICGRKFMKESALELHIANVHKDVPPTDPENCVHCPQCTIGFSTERAMFRHSLTAHGEWVPSTLKNSASQTTGAATDKRHTCPLLHKNDRRHKCNICGKGFIHSSALTEHVRAVHQKIRCVDRKRVAVAPDAIELDSENDSDGVALSEYVRVRRVHQKIRRVQKRRDDIAPEATELVYSGNESDENALSAESTQ